MAGSFLSGENLKILFGIFTIIGAIAGATMVSIRIYELLKHRRRLLPPISTKQRVDYLAVKNWYEALPAPSPIDRGHPKSTFLTLRTGELHLDWKGSLQLSEAANSRSLEISASLKNDEEMGFLDCEPASMNWDAAPLLAAYCSNRYSAYRAARELGVRLFPIMAGALVCCTDNDCVVYGERHPKVDTFKSDYHHFGGGLKAPRDMEPGDDNSLFVTAHRELKEETGLEIPHSRFQYASALIEGGTNYLQYCFLGVDITREERVRARPGSDVKSLEDFPIGELADRMIAKPFVPTCILQTMIWLSIGAPTTSERSFDPATIGEQLNKLKKHYSIVEPARIETSA